MGQRMINNNQFKDINDVLKRCIGIRFKQRRGDDPHVLVCLMIGDDGQWIEKDYSIDSYWLDELIVVATEAKKRLEQEAVPNSDGFGFRFNLREYPLI